MITDANFRESGRSLSFDNVRMDYTLGGKLIFKKDTLRNKTQSKTRQTNWIFLKEQWENYGGYK